MKSFQFLLIIIFLSSAGCQSVKNDYFQEFDNVFPQEGQDDDLVTAPILIGGLPSIYSHVQYPERAKKAGYQGRVSLTFIVTKDGYTRNIRAVEGRRSYGLGTAAIRAMAFARFEPGRDESGNVVNWRMSLPITFKLR